MARTLQWRKFFFGDWYGDTELHLCSSATRGIWMDALAIMDERNSYQLTGTVSELSRILYAPETEIVTAINELLRYKAADIFQEKIRLSVTQRYSHAGVTDTVTLVSRRFKREIKTRKKTNKQTKERVRRHREKQRNANSNGAVTGQKTEYRSRSRIHTPTPNVFLTFEEQEKRRADAEYFARHPEKADWYFERYPELRPAENQESQKT